MFTKWSTDCSHGHRTIDDYYTHLALNKLKIKTNLGSEREKELG